MKTQQLLAKFIAKCPFAVLTQFAARGLIQDDLDALFQAERSRQYEGTVLFSAVAAAVADVNLGFAANFNQAYKEHREHLGVSLNSFYEKIKATELPISEAVVRHAAQRATQLQEQLDFSPRTLLPGYRVLSIDGNHLPETDKRLGPVRDAFDAPLPGTIVARFDHQRRLFDRAYLLADAHAQESATHARVVADLQPQDVLLADRHHCVLAFLDAIAQADAFFVIRQHGRFKGVLQDERREIGRTSTGMVYEQEIWTSDDAATAQRLRRITLLLDQPTRDGDREIHVLTNLPAAVDALTVANLYLLRWEEETGFYYLTTTLTCELKSVSHPQAALFLFCMAMLAFNVRQVVFAALYAEHDAEVVNEVSHFHISVEVARYTDGMLIALEEDVWADLIPSCGHELAQCLRDIAKSINLKKYKKSRRGPKKKKVIKHPGRPKTHLSTAKVLREAKNQRP